MKMIQTVIMLSTIVAMMAGCADEVTSGSAMSMPTNLTGDAISVFIVYDGSGSMGDSVKNSKGERESKAAIANRALIAVGNRLNSYLASNTNRTIGLGMVRIFEGRSSFTDFKVMKGSTEGFFSAWANKYCGEVAGGTPLGNAIRLAGENMAKIQGTQAKHILILTDGMSNSGPSPDVVIPQLTKGFGVHLIAFDTKGGIFDNLKKNNVTVVEAADEKQLDSQFNFILNEKILLERED